MESSLIQNHKLSVLGVFGHIVSQKPNPTVLELGTCRSELTRSTMHEDWVPQAVDYIGTDFQDGLDVDVVVDAHKLSSAFGENRFDIVISCSTYEHFQYPWIVTIEICRVLKPGGVVFVQTHQTFPLHAHPHDYWRFSVDGLRALFSRQVGFQVITADHEFPCKIVSERDPNTETLPSFLNACLVAEKIAHPAPDCAYAPEI